MMDDELERYINGLSEEERKAIQEMLDNTFIGASHRLNEACMDLFVRPLLPLLTRILNLLAAMVEVFLKA